MPVFQQGIISVMWLKFWGPMDKAMYFILVNAFSHLTAISGMLQWNTNNDIVYGLSNGSYIIDL